jgi:biofilm PGA synthesis N-glycosyltransferase PgaC
MKTLEQLYRIRASAEFKMNKSPKHVIISPVRDEEGFLERTIESLLKQTIPPAEWVVVNDGSTDRTGEIIDRFAAEYSWIRAVHRANRGFRKPGGGVVEAFNEGLAVVKPNDWDFIVKLDGDLIFGKGIHRASKHFHRSPRLIPRRKRDTSTESSSLNC